MLITNSNIVQLGRQFSGAFRRGLERTSIVYPRFVTSVPSTTTQNDYAWMKQLKGVREWIGDREVENVSSHDYTLKNKSWEESVGVDRDYIEDDNLGIYTPLFEQLGENFAYHPQELLVSLMRTGHQVVCYDGQNFFDTDHPGKDINGADTTFSNYSASGLALSLDNAMTVRATMLSRRNEHGKSIASNPRVLVVPPALEKTAREIASASVVLKTTTSPGNLAAGVTNVAALEGMFDVVVMPELAGDDTTWYLFDLSRTIKPFLFQTRRGTNFVQKTQPNDEGVFWQKQLAWGADARYNLGVTFWQLGYKAVA